MDSPHAFTSSIDAPASASRPTVRPEFAAAAARRDGSFASDFSDTKVPVKTLENDAFVDALALAIKKSLGIGLGISSSAPDEDSGTSLKSGLVLRSAGPRTDSQVQSTRVLVSRHDRGRTPDERKKLRERVCIKLASTISVPDYATLLSPHSSEDMGAFALDRQTAHRALLDWLTAHDIHYVGQMPLVSDYSDLHQVAQATEFVDLFDTHTSVPAAQVHQYQALINVHGSSVDAESCEWLLSVLEKSTAPSLLQQVKQAYDSLPSVQRGGLSLYKLVMDRIDLRSFESIQGLVSFLSGFDLRSFDGENVPIATSRFKAVMMALPASSVPANVLEFYLHGMAQASSEEFKEVCSSLRGSINNPMYMEWAYRRPIAFQFDSFAGTLLAKYESLCAVNKWSGVDRKASAFKTALVPPPRKSHPEPPSAPAAVRSQPKAHKYPSYEAWFDAQTCDVCGGKHPTRFHDDPGARERGGKRVNSTRRRYTFKDSAARSRFNRAVHQAMLDTCDLDDNDEVVNVMEDAVTADGFDADPSPATADDSLHGSSGDPDDAFGMAALVAAGLRNLVKD
jgi:hypothetical protein